MKKPEIKFGLDRSQVKFTSLRDDPDGDAGLWLSRPVEERFYAIEFLRHQYMEMMGIPAVMDRKYFDTF